MKPATIKVTISWRVFITNKIDVVFVGKPDLFDFLSVDFDFTAYFLTFIVGMYS